MSQFQLPCTLTTYVRLPPPPHSNIHSNVNTQSPVLEIEE
jgi:hypothetical protein